MPRRLLICCDGTWDTPDHLDQGMVRPTNVAKLALTVEPVDLGGLEQRVYYHPGVGTGRFDHLRGGLFGWGLSVNILDAYRFLIEEYHEGDEIWLFGFSRGAYTARSLAGLIRECGVLRQECASKLPDAYALYRRRDQASHPSELEAQLFRRSYSVAPDPRIKFIGVWDTVGSLGIPYGVPALPVGLVEFANRDLGFHDLQLSSIVENAFQALAINEKRPQFQATLWEERNLPNQRLEQVWFAGVHSSVGGGFADTGLSDLALQWMMDKAQEVGLPLDRALIPPPFAPDFRGELRNSKTGVYALFRDSERVIGDAKYANQFSHQSAVERMDTPELGYQPRNLASFLAGGGVIAR